MTTRKQKQFLLLYDPVHDRFERFCRARVYGQMDFRDLMNDALLIAFQKFQTLQSEKAFLSFLFGICIRLLANQNRKKQEVSLLEGFELLQLPATNQSDSSTEVYFLHQALAQLPDAQKESIILFEISGFSVKEIAQLHSVSESAVKKRLERGRLQLVKLLTDLPIQPTEKEVNHG